MKKSLLITVSFLLFVISCFAQNSVQLNINHKLGDADFVLETNAKNNLDHDFEVTRLQYYISEITIVHDNGMETLFDETWVLVNASQPTQIDLGEKDINSVEMVKLHIGVDSSHNHLDPATYPASHPLAPQFPSMHWGWTSGYRFVAFEGYGGSNFDQLFQLHGLGNQNYFTTEIPVSVEAVNHEVIINIDADYARALEDIEVNSGLIVHGAFGAAKQCLENFRDFVFSDPSGTTSTIDFSEVSQFNVFPNPTTGNATIALDATQDLEYEVSVTDILGRQIIFFDRVKSNSTIDLRLENTGFYFVNLIKEGQVVITQKLISK